MKTRGADNDISVIMVIFAGGRGRHEMAAITQGLGKEKSPVQGDRGGNREQRLSHRIGSYFRRLCEVGKDQAKDSQGYQHDEESIGPLQVMHLFAMSKTAQEKRNTDKPVEDNHQNRKHHVTTE